MIGSINGEKRPRAFQVNGSLLIGADDVLGAGPSFTANDSSTGSPLNQTFHGGTDADVALACALAEEAFDVFRETPADKRADFLDRIAQEIEAIGDVLVDRAVQETGLPQARIQGERARTSGQLRMFAALLRAGKWSDTEIDPADSGRTPPKPDLRLRQIAGGPVAVFGASNFPLAFSVAGGDTASALAAGCPVVLKGHPAHTGTSELVGRAIRAAVQACGLPSGVFSLLIGADHAIGEALVAHPAIKSVAFTGSRGGGMALMAVAARRAEPIPFHAEMGSINPVFILPGALNARAASLAAGYVGSLTLGAGQFCTNPGMLIAIDNEDVEQFLAAASAQIAQVAAAPMLTPAIYRAFQEGVRRLSESAAAELISQAPAGTHPYGCNAALFVTDAGRFFSDDQLAQEVFGASSIIVRCRDARELCEVARRLEGQLTATLHCEQADYELARDLMRVLERKAGRILFNGWPTGVEVSPAMVHGGPFPASSDSRTTSVGTRAIERFLRPVCYQDCPPELLPSMLQTPV